VKSDSKLEVIENNHSVDGSGSVISDSSAGKSKIQMKSSKPKNKPTKRKFPKTPKPPRTSKTSKTSMTSKTKTAKTSKTKDKQDAQPEPAPVSQADVSLNPPSGSSSSSSSSSTETSDLDSGRGTSPMLNAAMSDVSISQKGEKRSSSSRRSVRNKRRDTSSFVVSFSDEWEVESVNDKKEEPNGETLYRVHWKGFTSASDSWEPVANLLPNSCELISAYESSKKKIRSSSSDTGPNTDSGPGTGSDTGSDTGHHTGSEINTPTTSHTTDQAQQSKQS